MNKRTSLQIVKRLLSATRRLGIVKEYDRPNILLLDYDGDVPSYDWFVARMRVLGIKPNYFRYDKTEHGYHVVIELNREYEPMARLALQAILGSDYRRESLNWYRLINSNGYSKNWNILYERKIYASKNGR